MCRPRAERGEAASCRVRGHRTSRANAHLLTGQVPHEPCGTGLSGSPSLASPSRHESEQRRHLSEPVLPPSRVLQLRASSSRPAASFLPESPSHEALGVAFPGVCQDLALYVAHLSCSQFLPFALPFPPADFLGLFPRPTPEEPLQAPSPPLSSRYILADRSAAHLRYVLWPLGNGPQTTVTAETLLSS